MKGGVLIVFIALLIAFVSSSATKEGELVNDCRDKGGVLVKLHPVGVKCVNLYTISLDK